MFADNPEQLCDPCIIVHSLHSQELRYGLGLFELGRTSVLNFASLAYALSDSDHLVLFGYQSVTVKCTSIQPVEHPVVTPALLRFWCG